MGKRNVPKLLEFFCIRETDDRFLKKGDPGFDDLHPRSHVGETEPTFKPKPMGVGSFNIRNVKSQERTPPSRAEKPPIWATSHRKNSPPTARVIPQHAKPPYRGTFIGQTFSSNDKVVSKNTSWLQKPSGDRMYGRTPSMQKVDLVWDGNDWVTDLEFRQKAKDRQLKK